MRLKTALIGSFALLAFANATAADLAALAQQVRDSEKAFAATMAARDHAAFTRHLSDDAVFFDGDKAIRGKAAVAAAWKGYYEGPNAPFSWTPEHVEVIESGTLAHSSGPVFDAKGTRAGTFNSVWRREADGTWRVVFDKACSACVCAQTKGDEQR